MAFSALHAAQIMLQADALETHATAFTATEGLVYDLASMLDTWLSDRCAEGWRGYDMLATTSKECVCVCVD